MVAGVVRPDAAVCEDAVVVSAADAEAALEAVTAARLQNEAALGAYLARVMLLSNNIIARVTLLSNKHKNKELKRIGEHATRTV